MIAVTFVIQIAERLCPQKQHKMKMMENVVGLQMIVRLTLFLKSFFICVASNRHSCHRLSTCLVDALRVSRGECLFQTL